MSTPTTSTPLVALLGASRARIVEHLAASDGARVAELATLLEISDAAVRKHLDRLAEDGLVTSTLAAADGPGRPSRVHVLTEEGLALLPRDYAGIARDLMTFLRDEQGRDGMREFLRWRLERQAGDLAAQVHAEEVPDRVDELASALSRAGFSAQVVPTADGYDLVQTNCTIRELAAENPQLCAYEAASFKRVLGDVQISRKQTIAAGDAACVCHVQTEPRREAG